MAAPIPELANAPAGMVHFKSILDPLWSEGELASLRDTVSWVLLVLSPFDRFYELDPFLDDLSASAPRLVIWRPDRPTVEESARLRIASLVSPAARRETAMPVNGPDRAANKGAGLILTTIYVMRGSLIVQGVRHSIHRELGDLSLQQYVSSCLACLAAAVPARNEVSLKEAEQLAMRWAALLCGHEDPTRLSLFACQSQVLAWATRYLSAESGMLKLGLPLPEPFMTTSFLNEINSFNAARDRVHRIFESLRNGEVPSVQAMMLLAQAFSGDESRLTRWRGLAENLTGFLNWLPAFERSYDYLSGSFTTRMDELEQIKKNLLEACTQPQRFLRAAERDRFDRGFADFKKGYIDYYHSIHQETLHLVANQKRMKARVDSMALRNLELLSDLRLADRSFLNRARAIGKFVQANQCDLPDRDILERQPRCYCNFNPAAGRLLAKSVDRMNEAALQGIDYFRALLRRCRLVIIQELKIMNADDHHARQIAALLSRGPMIPLQQGSIDLLNTIMQNHPEEFGSRNPQCNRPRVPSARA